MQVGIGFFLINVPIGIIGIWFTLKIMPDFHAPETAVARFDVSGFFLFAAGAVSLSLAIETLTHPGSHWFSISLGLFGMAALWLYLQHANQDKQALYPLNLMQVRTFRLGIAGNLASRLGMAAVPFLLPLLLQLAFGRSPSESGWILAPIALAALMTKPLIKSLIRCASYRNVLIWNTRLIGIIIIMLSLPTAATPLWLLIPLLFLLGMCNSLQYSAMNTLTIANLRPGQASSGNSLMAVNQQLSVSLGIALGALLLNRFSIPEISGGNLHNAFRYTFWVIGIITFSSSQVFARLHKYDGANLTER